MDERLPDSTYDALHHFISVSSWDGLAVMDEVARRVQASLAPLGGEQGLLLDECGWEKAGHHSVGVARQYSGQVGKVSNGQVGVFAVLSRGTHAGLVGGQLYRPQTWSIDAARCTQARILAAAQAYRTKPELAAELVKHLLVSGLVQADWVGATRPTATRPPCARPWKAANRPTCSTSGRTWACTGPTRPRPRRRPAPGGAVPPGGFSPR
ncbi:hypothetical protein DDQ68_01165 [Hymenobacter nivis]|uniref:Transposase IS701-like DDE domain-containing protein n=1 Tax=Hymenobacter nivis TaxID=1850093 RepID=A0A2Z3GIH7_9BACT|nr:transposase [Hymenobacter nivis]AWM31517.1 hypothetical protein DDQ68_01165 [Hymenobacter nivis]